jgi:hypothetical protein
MDFIKQIPNFIWGRLKERSTWMFWAAGFSGLVLHFFPEAQSVISAEKIMIALTFLGLVPDKK